MHMTAKTLFTSAFLGITIICVLLISGCGPFEGIETTPIVGSNIKPPVPTGLPQTVPTAAGSYINVLPPDPVATQVAAVTMVAMRPTIQSQTATTYAMLPTATRVLVVPDAEAHCPVPTPIPQPTGSAKRPWPRNTEARIVTSRQFRTWCYLVYNDYLGTHAVFSIDQSTVAALKSFADDNKQLAKQLANSSDQAEVTIWFRSPMEPEQFRDWAKAKDLQVRESGLPVVPGWESFIAGNYARIVGNLIDPLVAMGNQDLKMYEGVVESRAVAQSARLPEIAADPLVFLVDVSRSILYQDTVRLAQVRDLSEFPQIQFGFGDTWSIYRNMKMLGLENFQK